MKTILIYDKRAKRAPLVWPMYANLQDFFNVAYMGDLNVSVQKAMSLAQMHVGGEVCAILWGMLEGKALENSREYLNKTGIPIIVTVSDMEQFITLPSKTKQFWGMKNVKYLLYKQRAECQDGDTYLKRLRTFMQDGVHVDGPTAKEYGEGPRTFLQGAKILFSPWALNYDRIKIDHDKKDIAVSFLCTQSGAEAGDKRRREMRNILSTLEPAKCINPTYGEDYYKTLYRTKILVCENRDSGLTTQKYVEAAAYGCLVVGDVPYLDPEVFIPGETMLACDPDYLPNVVRYYLKHEDERRKIAAALLERMKHYYHLDAAIYQLVKEFKADEQ